ncbi:peptidyl-prolyl cis-trans isomerase [Shewanella corallii]|uniref:Peptidyl-prolyl cis-trans isomerase n=1 Tax=Shewanella corallii TaxID=560080 RepID=A0ABT0NAS1_9GAMM|nr:peptidylprolyl isomerase [Shewanella corallii]MCL2915524.1 peptidyl-prolyl cis-trans isomerase [Shewanella corallii]
MRHADRLSFVYHRLLQALIGIGREPLAVYLALTPFIYWFFSSGLLGFDNEIDQISHEGMLQRVASEHSVPIASINEYWAGLSETERMGIRRRYLETKLLSLRARELGLQQSDTVIEGRLAQKLNLVLEQGVTEAAPGSQELRSFYQQRPELYTSPARFSISFTFSPMPEQAGIEPVLYSPQPRGNPAIHQLYLVSEHSLTEKFGSAFIRELQQQEAHQWSRTLDSELGKVQVWIHVKYPSRHLAFDEVRQQVLADWRADAAKQRQAHYIERLKKKYADRIDEALLP